MLPSNGNYLLREALKDSSKVVACVEEALQKDFIKALGKIMAQVDMNDEQRKACYKKVIAYKNLEALQVMHDNDRGTRDLSPQYLRLILQLDDAGWTEGVKAIAGKNGYCGTTDVFNFLGQTMPDHIHDMVASARSHHVKIRDLATHASHYDATRMARYIDLSPQRIDANQLARLACNVLGSQQDDKVKDAAISELIKRGMNVNFDNGAVMLAALRAGRVDIAQKLMDEGLEPALVRTHVYENLCATGAPRASLDFAKAFKGTAVPVADTGGAFTRGDDYSVSCVQALPGNGKLTMLFNFATGQQIVIAQMGDQLSAPAIVEFSRIENRTLLEKAAEAYVAQGGDAALSAAAIATTRKTLVAKAPQQAGS